MKKIAARLAVVAFTVTPSFATSDFICQFANGDAGSDLAVVTGVTVSGDADWLYLWGKKDDGSTFSMSVPMQGDPPDSALSVREGENGYLSGGGYYEGTAVAFSMSNYRFTLVFVHPGEAYTFVYDCKPAY